MVEMWTTLAPLIIVSAVLPLQIIVILLLVRSSLRAAFTWVAGMTAVRLAQGILFGFVFSGPQAQEETTSPPFVGALLLVVALLMYTGAFKKMLAGKDNTDEDAPPSKWTAKVASFSPLAAFAAGAGYIAINGKLWIFTLTAIDAIESAHLGAKLGFLMFLLFVALAQSVSFAILLLASSPSSRATAILDGLTGWLRRNARIVSVVLSLVFGTWFLLKALGKLGVLG